MKTEQQLTALFDQETSSLQQLWDVLQEEHTALTGTDIEAVERATSNKNRALANQANATSARIKYAAQSGAGDSIEEMRQLIASFSNSDELAGSFSTLVSLAKECHQANRNNGRLIVEKQQQAALALDVLRQVDSNLATYSGQGRAVSKSATRSLGKA